MAMNPFDTLVASLMSTATKSSLEKTEEDMKEVFSKIDEMLPGEPEILEELSFEDVVKWFHMQPKHPDFKYGALVKMPLNHDCIVVLQAFLNHYKDVIPKYENRQYIRKLIISSIDSELAEHFGNNNAIIFE